MAGLHKHKWSFMVKYAPDHFGSNRWHPPHPTNTEKWLNVYDLDRMSNANLSLDLGAMGYDKLLGQGTVSKALSVKVPRASASAVEKIKAAGGNITVEFVPKPEKPEPKKEEPKQGQKSQKPQQSQSQKPKGEGAKSLGKQSKNPS